MENENQGAGKDSIEEAAEKIRQAAEDLEHVRAQELSIESEDRHLAEEEAIIAAKRNELHHKEQELAKREAKDVETIDVEIEKIKNHEKKHVTIIVEGTPHEWSKEEIAYAEVVTLEVPDYAQHPEITYAVKYRNGPGSKPEGILAPGGSVKVKEGMIFNVSETGQS